MKTEKNILIAFILNLCFSFFEFFGGIYTGSVAIISDALHDVGDAASIGISYFLERKSKRAPDGKYTYGYARYSVIGGSISAFILLFGSVTVIYNAIGRIITPTPINYNGMIIFAVIGALVNAAAAFFTRHGDSLNQKAVNLHMLEDVLGWIIVLIGAIVIKSTGFLLIDPIMSIGVAAFIFFNAAKTLKEIIDIFLEKTPHNIDVNEIREHIMSIDSVIDVHHIHVWTMDGQNNYATMHVVTNADNHEIKHRIRRELHELGISHVTLELEDENEHCHERHCSVKVCSHDVHHHHHHHHH
ncbi:MAG: cation transporter [Oscillospiraceae bacterium]|nr:cation transporter [Oscillospiraceae bacterium]